MRYSISNAIPHNPKSKKHPYENLVKIRLCGHLRRYKKIVKKIYIISGNYCIIDINSDLYMVSMSDGLRVDSFYEDQLERAW